MHNDELHGLCNSPYVSRVGESVRMRWAATWQMQTAVWWGNVKKRDHLDVLDVDGRTVKWLMMKERLGIL